MPNDKILEASAAIVQILAILFVRWPLRPQFIDSTPDTAWRFAYHAVTRLFHVRCYSIFYLCIHTNSNSGVVLGYGSERQGLSHVEPIWTLSAPEKQVYVYDVAIW